MAAIEKIEDIVAWQKGRELTRLVDAASQRAEFARDFVLKAQITCAAISITSNIA
ncbi:MAG: four helix bundle protein [Planctomycetaceae bacterium]